MVILHCEVNYRHLSSSSCGRRRTLMRQWSDYLIGSCNFQGLFMAYLPIIRRPQISNNCTSNISMKIKYPPIWIREHCGTVFGKVAGKEVDFRSRPIGRELRRNSRNPSKRLRSRCRRKNRSRCPSPSQVWPPPEKQEVKVLRQEYWDSQDSD